MIIFDADILSMFAKADSLDIMTKTLAKFRICITPRIKEELSIPLQYGFVFPEKIFDTVELLFPTASESSLYDNFRNKYNQLGKGELEAISVAISRNCIFATNDKKAFAIAAKEGLTIINIHTILVAMLRKKILDVDGIKEFIHRLESADNTVILDKEKIFSRKG